MFSAHDQDSVEFTPGVDPHAFRNALGRFATGVTVVTTMADGAPVGVTANAFTSVSLKPPLVLVCLGESLGCLDAFKGSEHFAISVLASDQETISARFATKGIDRFEHTAWRHSERGLPILDNVLASIECAKHAQMEFGDHTIFIGEVLTARCVINGDPLLFYGGEFRRLCGT